MTKYILDIVDIVLITILTIIVIGFVYFKWKETISKKKDRFDNNIVNINVDKIFYINMDKRPDRNNQIKNELLKVGVDLDKYVERYPAIYDSKNGHIGCAKSHRNILDIAIERKYNKIMILEDDFIFTDMDVVSKANTFLDNFNNDWDVIQLGIGYKKLIPLEQKDYKFNINGISRVESGTSSYGYMINKSIFKLLRDNINEAIELMEKEAVGYNSRKLETQYAMDQYWSKLQKTSKWFVFQPVLGKQGGPAGKSSIMDMEGFMDI
jgi:hypothetical protein